MACDGKEDWGYYRFCDAVDIAIRSTYIPLALQDQIEPLKISNSKKPMIELVICRFVQDFPNEFSYRHSGFYKGVAWQFVVLQSASGASRIYFYSAFFSTFLIIRMVLLPVLKQHIVLKGGFSLIGSAFAWRGKCIVLFGYPGSGKTRLLLEAVKRGGQFLGDCELFFTADQKVGGIFKYLEFRYATVKRLWVWKLLAWHQKMRLMIYQWISLMSGRKISFNLLVDPKDLEIEAADDKDRMPVVFVCLSKKAGKQSATLEEVKKAVTQYENDYRKLFGECFFTENDLEKSLKNMDQFLSQAALWRLPSDCSLDAVLELD